MNKPLRRGVIRRNFLLVSSVKTIDHQKHLNPVIARRTISPTKQSHLPFADSEALVADGVVYVSDSSHLESRGARHLYALDATTSEQLWVFESQSSFLPAPELGDGTIYVTSGGEVIALH